MAFDRYQYINYKDVHTTDEFMKFMTTTFAMQFFKTEQ